ncbi:MAG: alpha/beta fold hydrolase [Acidimicrobiales bacterium]
MLWAEREGSGPRLVLVHGFTQTRASWGPVATDLARDHQVVRVDAPGHGRSAAVRANLARGADLVAATGGVATYIGYSMGGRLCLHAALVRPEVVRGLVLVGTTAGIADADERSARAARDRELARRLQRDGLDAFLEGWLRQPLLADLPEAAWGLEARRENTTAGLAASLRLAGTGAQEPLWDHLGGLAMPVLVTAGSRDARFAGLAPRLAAAVGANATVGLVPDAGHAAHLHRPQAFLDLLRPWLARHGL